MHLLRGVGSEFWWGNPRDWRIKTWIQPEATEICWWHKGSSGELIISVAYLSLCSAAVLRFMKTFLLHITLSIGCECRSSSGGLPWCEWQKIARTSVHRQKCVLYYLMLKLGLPPATARIIDQKDNAMSTECFLELTNTWPTWRTVTESEIGSQAVQVCKISLLARYSGLEVKIVRST